MTEPSAMVSSTLFGLPRRRRDGTEGVALVTTLLLLTLFSILALAMVIATSSDSIIIGYYRNFRGAFYAADSGLNIARQQLVNQITAAVPPNFTTGASPIPLGTDAAVQAAILTSFGAKTSINRGQAAGSWPGSFRITSASLLLVTACSPQPCTPPPYTSVTTDANGKIISYQYTYNYSLTAVGESTSGEQTTLFDKGNLIFNAVLQPATGKTSFAAWGMFIDQWAQCSGGYLVPGTITGPVFTNGSWTFGSSGSYIFTDPVGSASATAGYQFPSGCYSSSASSYTDPNGTTISPNFQAGFNPGQPPIPLPQNDFDQKRAVLDGKGTGNTPVTNAELNANLRDANGNPYPATGATSGVYLPYKSSVNPNTGATVLTFTGGGIYVEGDAQVTMAASGASAEVYTVTQGSTITTITIDNVANTTTISTNGGAPNTISGVPTQYDPSSGNPARPATMVYANGNITSLSGPHDANGNSLPAVNDSQAITVTAAKNITVTGDVLLKTEPVTTTQDQPPMPVGTPPDTLIPGNDKGQVLGIFTAGGDVQMVNSQSSTNLEIDASIATLAQGGTGGLVNMGSAINTLTIIGGRIQNQIKNINATSRNVFFDRRFSQGGFAPPWFPSTTITNPGKSSAKLDSSAQRVQWLNKTTF